MQTVRSATTRRQILKSPQPFSAGRTLKVATEKAAKAMAAGLMSDICAALGDGEILVGPGGKPIVTWKSAKDTVRTDWEAVATDLGATADQIAAHTETTPGSRRFVVKEANLPAAEAPEADNGNSHEASAA